MYVFLMAFIVRMLFGAWAAKTTERLTAILEVLQDEPNPSE